MPKRSLSDSSPESETFYRSVPGLLLRRQGALLLCTLDRPEVHNSLSLGMIHSLEKNLSNAAGDPAVRAVIIQGAGERAFCAGGDVKAVCGFDDHDSRGASQGASQGASVLDGSAGVCSREKKGLGQACSEDSGLPGRKDKPNFEFADLYFGSEYRLNRLLHTYPKPIMALLDGYVMGGGVGLAAPCPYRIITERTAYAMPEVKIGFFPDVGSSYYLQRWPGLLGLFMMVSGYILRHERDLLYTGAGTHFLSSEEIPGLIERLEKAFAAKEPPLSSHNSRPKQTARLLSEILSDAGAVCGGGKPGTIGGVGTASGYAGPELVNTFEEHGDLHLFEELISETFQYEDIKDIYAALEDLVADEDSGNNSEKDLRGSKTWSEQHGLVDGRRQEFIRQIMMLMKAASPLSMQFARSYYTLNLGSDIDVILSRDFLAAAHLMRSGEFCKGVSAALVEKIQASWDDPPLEKMTHKILLKKFKETGLFSEEVKGGV